MRAAATSSAFSVGYAARLVEEAVLRAEASLHPSERAVFRAQRNPIYDAADPEERDARFEELHGRWFLRLGLDRALHEALEERPELQAGARGCRVLEAPSRRDELADLVLETGEARPTIVVRLRPESLLDPGCLRALLRRELAHVADMLDPAFGYERELPPSEWGATHDKLLRERYRVVWQTSVEGRLARRGWLEAARRDTCLAEFARAFPMLGGSTEQVFAAWYEKDDPTHAQIVAFVRRPDADTGACCPLCRLPAGALDAAAASLPAAALAELRVDFPNWRSEQGLCDRCAEIYRVRARGPRPEARVS